MNHYHNTVKETEKVSEYEAKAMKQDELVFLFFKNERATLFRNGFTPSEVWKETQWLTNSPITSIRRAITNLTNAGKLVKTEEKRKGIYGRNENVWKLAV